MKRFEPVRFHLFHLWLMLLLGPMLSPCLAEEALSLDDAIDFALKNSPVLSAAKSEAEAAQFGVKAAKGQMLPQIQGYAGYDRKSDPVVVVPIKEFGGRPPAFSRDQYRAGVSVIIPIYQGGRLWARLDAANYTRQIASHTLSFTRQDLIANVTNLFNQVLYLMELSRAQETALDALKKARRDAKVRLEIGRIAPVDLMRLDTQVARQEQALITARERERRALSALSMLMGWDRPALPRLTGHLDCNDGPAALPRPDELIERAWRQRPDIKAAQAEVQKAEAELEYARGSHLPSLGLVGDYSRHAGSGLHYDEEIWTGGVALSINIFSGGTLSAQVGQAASRLSAARQRLRALKLKARQDVMDALSALQEAEQRLKVSTEAERAAKEGYRIEQLKYDSGAGSVTDSLLAQAAWQQAMADRVSALYYLKKALVDLRLALGEVDREVSTR
jgi:TolC family type I secretion outer membrane protein